MVGVRLFKDGRCEEVPAHLLLDLLDSDDGEGEDKAEHWATLAADLAPVEAFVYERFGTPTLEKVKRDTETRFDDRRKHLQRAFNLYEAELLERRLKLKEAVAKGTPAAAHKLRKCDDELNALDGKRSVAEAAMLLELDSIRLGPVTVYARALVLPVPPEQTDKRRDDRVEAIAMRIAREYEESRQGVVEDVSDPTRRMGFDLRSTRADGQVRFIEVKGRARIGEVELTDNEWKQARNHPDRYWLYVVYNCDSTPKLYRVKDPAGKGIGKPKGGVTIDINDVFESGLGER
jgi:hypothetical protein